MVAPSWNHVFPRVQATQVGVQHGGPELEPRVFPGKGLGPGFSFSRFPPDPTAVGPAELFCVKNEVKCEFSVEKVRFVETLSRKVRPPSRILDK